MNLVNVVCVYMQEATNLVSPLPLYNDRSLCVSGLSDSTMGGQTERILAVQKKRKATYLFIYRSLALHMH